MRLRRSTLRSLLVVVLAAVGGCDRAAPPRPASNRSAARTSEPILHIHQEAMHGRTLYLGVIDIERGGQGCLRFYSDYQADEGWQRWTFRLTDAEFDKLIAPLRKLRLDEVPSTHRNPRLQGWEILVHLRTAGAEHEWRFNEAPSSGVYLFLVNLADLRDDLETRADARGDTYHVQRSELSPLPSPPGSLEPCEGPP